MVIVELLTYNMRMTSINYLHLISRSFLPRMVQQIVGRFIHTSALLRSWQLHTIPVRTNVEVWHEKLEGVDFDVLYYDTMSTASYSERKITPTVFAVHSLSGTVDDLLPLLKPIADTGCRVIAPYLPSCGLTKGRSAIDEEFFTHTTLEYDDLLISFMGTINVSGVSVMIGYGSGATLTLPMAAAAKSLLLINPIPSQKLCPFLHTISSTKVTVLKRATKNSIMKRYAMKRLKSIFEDNGIELTSENIHGVLEAIRNIQHHVIMEATTVFESSPKPLVYVYSSDDPVVSKEFHSKFAESLGIVDHFESSSDLQCNDTMKKALLMPSISKLSSDKACLELLLKELIWLVDCVTSNDKSKTFKNFQQK